MKQYGADIVFQNGNVITVDPQDRIAEALAVKGNIISFVGTNEEVKQWIGPETRVIDLNGRSLLPGLIDAHMHLAETASNEFAVDCSYPKVKSIEDIKNKIREAAQKAKPGQWIRGFGYDQNELAEHRHPNYQDLDEAAPDNPVVILRVCGHMAVNNSRALKIYGIEDRLSEYPSDNIEIVDGKLTGRLIGQAYMDTIELYEPSEEEYVHAVLDMKDKLIRSGLTSIHDAGSYGPNGAKQMRVYQKVTEHNDVKLRIYAMAFSYPNNITYAQDVINSGMRTGFGDNRLRLGSLKTMVDGSTSGPTSATLEPYCSDPDNQGVLYTTQEKLNDLFLKAHLAGFQITAHATGDKAVEMVVNAIENALKIQPRKNHRHRIEHCFLVNKDLIRRIKELEIIPVVQPVFYHDFGDSYFVNYGEERVNRTFTSRTFIDQGVTVAAGSDSPVASYDPVMGIHMVVNRTTLEGKVAGEKERVSVMEAIKMYTINGAYASFEEDIKGSLETGKLADLVVLSDSILDADPAKIKDLNVDMTIIDGNIEYER